MNAASSSPLRIGWSCRDVSTDRAVGINGQFFRRISKGVLDPLTVTALAISNDEDSVIFLSGDLLIVAGVLLAEVRERVAAQNPEIPAAKLFFSATHTHAAANHYPVAWGGNYSARVIDENGDERELMSGDEYRAFFAERAAAAVVEAWQRRAPGAVAWGYGFATTGQSRRTIYLDDVSQRPAAHTAPGLLVNGHGVMYGRTDDDKFSHYEAGTDSIINFLYTFDAEGRLTGAVINTPCPSQVTGRIEQLSADFWHDVRVALRERHGEVYVLPQCAAAGDLSPRLLHYGAAQQRRFRLKYGAGDGEFEQLMALRRDIAGRIAAAFDEVLEWARRETHAALPIRHVVETVALDRRPVTEEDYRSALDTLAELDRTAAADETGTPKERFLARSVRQSALRRSEGVIERYEEQQCEPKLATEIHVVRIGEIAFASNRFELFMDYMHRIQGRSPFEQTFVVQLAASSERTGGSYLATCRGAENRGYSATVFCNLVSPAGGQKLVDETVRILKEIHES